MQAAALPAETAKMLASGGVLGAGLIVALCALATKRTGAQAALLATGCVLIAAGILGVLCMPVEWFQPGVQPAPASSGSLAARAVPPPKGILRSPASAAPLAGSLLSWPPDAALERVVEFDSADAPAAVRAESPRTQAAHAPAAVPALPRKTRLAYAPAYEPRQPALQEDFTPPSPMPVSVGPVYYKPLSKFPTVNDIVQQRAVLQSRPDTPELDRHRRIALLREYALSIPVTAQRSGLQVPAAGAQVEAAYFITPPARDAAPFGAEALTEAVAAA